MSDVPDVMSDVSDVMLDVLDVMSDVMSDVLDMSAVLDISDVMSNVMSDVSDVSDVYGIDPSDTSDKVPKCWASFFPKTFPPYIPMRQIKLIFNYYESILR